MALIHDRWAQQQRLDLRSLLSSGGCRSPFGLTDEGYCDFRGICIDESLHSLRIENVDLANAKVGQGQLMAFCRQCRFVDFACDGNLGERFEDCTFQRARLSNSVFYGRFVNCDFSGANLTGVRGRHIQFERCTFHKTNLRKASFYDSVFRNCTFANCTMRSGSLVGSSFEDCEINGFDLAKTVTERVKGLAQGR